MTKDADKEVKEIKKQIQKFRKEAKELDKLITKELGKLKKKS